MNMEKGNYSIIGDQNSYILPQSSEDFDLKAQPELEKGRTYVNYKSQKYSTVFTP